MVVGPICTVTRRFPTGTPLKADHLVAESRSRLDDDFKGPLRRTPVVHFSGADAALIELRIADDDGTGIGTNTAADAAPAAVAAATTVTDAAVTAVAVTTGRCLNDTQQG